MSEKEYYTRLQIFVNNMLTNVIPSQTERNKFLGLAPMKIWAKAFTHESVDPNENYENLEYLGDASLRAAFPWYISRRFPNLSKENYTNLNSYYMGKTVHYELSQKLNLASMLRMVVKGKGTIGIKADLIESMLGALHTIGDSISLGYGYSLVYNFVVYLFKDYDMDMAHMKGSYKTIAMQIFNRFLTTDPTKTYRIEEFEQDGMVYISVYLSDAQVQFLAENNVRLGFNHHQNPVGYGVGETTMIAEPIAFKTVIDFLSQQGITDDWSEQKKRLQNFTELGELGQAAIKKSKLEGYVSLAFKISRKGDYQGQQLQQLIGYKENGQKIVLVVSNQLPSKQKEDRRSIIHQYLQM